MPNISQVKQKKNHNTLSNHGQKAVESAANLLILNEKAKTRLQNFQLSDDFFPIFLLIALSKMWNDLRNRCQYVDLKDNQVHTPNEITQSWAFYFFYICLETNLYILDNDECHSEEVNKLLGIQKNVVNENRTYFNFSEISDVAQNIKIINDLKTIDGQKDKLTFKTI